MAPASSKPALPYPNGFGSSEPAVGPLLHEKNTISPQKWAQKSMCCKSTSTTVK
jgi:hypothetical protein